VLDDASAAAVTAVDDVLWAGVVAMVAARTREAARDVVVRRPRRRGVGRGMDKPL